MLCLDTRYLIAYLQGDEGADVDLIDQVLIDQVGVLSPVTVAEPLSAPNLSPTLRRTILELPTLSMTQGFGNVPDSSEQKRSEPVSNQSGRYSHRSKLPRPSCDTCHTRS